MKLTVVLLCFISRKTTRSCSLYIFPCAFASTSEFLAAFCPIHNKVDFDFSFRTLFAQRETVRDFFLL